MTNPYQKYQQQSVMTMTRGEMLIKLYDETIKQLSAAQLYLGNHDFSGTNNALLKAQRILNYLKSTLDFQYEISENLSALYDYFVRQIIQANLRKNPAAIEEILPMISELRDTFFKADRAAKTTSIAN